MSALRGLRLSALCTIILGPLCLAAPSLAQVAVDPISARAPFSSDPNPLWRTPALLGMGRLTLAEDQNNHLELWDFARNPAGIYDADSTTTIQLRPGTSTTSSEQVMPIGSSPTIHQLVNDRLAVLGYEVWRRTSNHNAYGFYGDLTATRTARPYSADEGLSNRVNDPGGTMAVNGGLPFLTKGRMRYALRGTYVKSKTEDVYSLLAINPVGVYLDKGGDRVAPPDQLSPVESKNTYLGAGGALSYRFGRPFTLALGGDYLEERMSGRNQGERHLLETTEDRPYGIGQATVLGQVGKHLEYIADGRTWQAANENRYDYSISAGISNLPLTARGTRYSRYEEGTALKSRLRWVQGAFDLGAQFNTWYQSVRIGAPDPTDLTSYNHFLGEITNRAGADSLVIPDSIRTNQTDIHNYDWALGGSYHAKGGGRLGMEYHWKRSREDQTTSGAGPTLEGWDVRTGLEYPCAPLMRARVGYIYQQWDEDKDTQQNEYVTHTVTAGFGIGPVNGHWGVETGYAYEWGGPDYGEPFRLRGRQQQVAVQLRWTL